jgi:hypothetical protein
MKGPNIRHLIQGVKVYFPKFTHPRREKMRKSNIVSEMQKYMYMCLISIEISLQKRLLELDIEIKDLEPESTIDLEDEPPDVDKLFGFLDPKISDNVHVSPGTTVYGVSLHSSVAINIHLIEFILLSAFL